MRHLYFLTVTWLLIMLDQWSKYFFYNLQYGAQTALLEPVLNTGISRSISFHIPSVLAISFIALVAFIRIYFKKILPWYMVALLIAGTIGNMIDRIQLNGVRDFLYPFSWFPIFNIADILLSLAVILFCYLEFYGWYKKSKQ